MRNYYPDELRKIVGLCEALNEADKDSGDITFKNGVVVIDCNDNSVLGELVDEVGGSWSFKPAAS